MKLHFINPISILICRVVFGKKFDEAELFLMENSKYKKNDLLLSTKKQISTEFCKILNIKLSFTNSIECNYNSKCAIEPTISSFHNKNTYIIFQGSDMYCAFGFQNYLTNTKSKINLFLKWRNIKKEVKRCNQIVFSRGLKGIFFRKKRIVVNQFEFQEIMKTISNNESFRHLFNKYLDTSGQYLLVLPPIYNRMSEYFNDNFFKKVSELSVRYNLDIIIKPHQNDSFNYSTINHKFNKKLILFDENDRFFPVELLMIDQRISKIVAVPSSSLSILNIGKLYIFADKNPYNFRIHFLDQIPFLQRLNIKYELI